MKLTLYDLVEFKNIESKERFLEEIKTIKSIKSVNICETNHFRFDESTFKVLQEGFDFLTDWLTFYNNRYEIINIWRLDPNTHDYKNIYTVEII